MIRIVVDEQPNGPVVCVPLVNPSIRWEGEEAYFDENQMFVISQAAAPSTETYEYQLGSLVQDRQAVGKLREKGVKHLNVVADLKLSNGTFSIGRSELGSTVYETTAGVRFNVASFCNWGTASAAVSQPAPRFVVRVGDRFVVREPGYQTHRVLFAGDKFLVLAEQMLGEVHWADTGGVILAQRRLDHMVRYARDSNGVVYRCGTSDSGLGGFSPSEVSLFLAGASPSGIQIPQVSCTYVVGNIDVDSALAIAVGNIQRGLRNWHMTFDTVKPDWGAMSENCAAQLKFVDENLMFLAYDVANWQQFHSMWKQLTNQKMWMRALHAYQNLGSPVDALRDLRKIFAPGTSTYLSGKYGVLPDVSDIGRLFKGNWRLTNFLTEQRLHTREITPMEVRDASKALHTAVMTVQCAAYPTSITGRIQELIGLGKRFGAYPETVNLLDAVKYSFAVDWFVQFGDFFKDIDTWTNVKDYFPVDYVLMSQKWEAHYTMTTLAQGDSPVTGEVAFSYYTRWIEREVPLPSVSLHAESRLGSHLVESTALVLQRL